MGLVFTREYMQITRHAVGRMNSRGITQQMINLVYALGIDRGDKVVLTQKAAERRWTEAKAEQRAIAKVMDNGVTDLSASMHMASRITLEIQTLAKIIDKHGLVVVVCDNTLLTTYRYERTKYH